MRNVASGTAIAMLIGIGMACSPDQGDRSAGKAYPPIADAEAGARDSLAVSAPSTTSAVATQPQAPAHGAGTQGASREAAPVPAASGATSPPARSPAASGPRRVMLGDIDLTGVGYDAGSVTAPVVLIDFSDFGCPYCAEFTRETYPVIEREYVRTGKVFFKYVPFIVGMFPHAAEATRAVECTADQGLFWAMADRVYESQKVWKGAGDPGPLLMGIAGVAGADTSRFSQCYRSGRTNARTARANDIAATIGVRVTPSFVVNGRPVQGALPIADFRRVIDAALLVAQMHEEAGQ